MPAPSSQTPAPGAADAATPEARVRALAEEVLAGTDLFLVDVSVRGWKGSQVVEVYADRDADPGEGADLDALAEVSRQLGFLLETEDVMPGKYRLDVSSPGLDRPLTDPRQFRRHVGREVRLTLASGEAVEGTLIASTPEAVTVQPASGEPVATPHADLTDARILLPW